MTAKLEESPVKPDKSEASPLVLTIAMEPGDDSAPLRVLSLLARRRCRVSRAAFALRDDGGGSVLRVELEAPPGREATIVRWVSALVPVRDVEHESS